jgi:transcriptional antiterminator NusG
MNSLMDDPNADDAERQEQAVAPEDEARAESTPESSPKPDEESEPSESVAGGDESVNESANGETPVEEEVAVEHPVPPGYSRRPVVDEDEEAGYIPAKEAIVKSDAGSGRPALPAHMTDEDTPRDPSTVPLYWYVLKVQSNREKSIRDTLVRRIKREGYSEFFGDVVIPTEKVIETKGGKRKVREQKLFPGYMMIQCRLTDETWFLVRDTSGVGDFTGAAGRPIPMQEHEIERMLGGTEVAGEEEKPHRPVVKFSVVVGDVVKVKEGAFESFEGTVDTLDEASGKVKVIIEIFGRPTEVELEHWQVEKA